MDIILKTLAVSIGFVVVLWLPVFWSYLFARWKKLAKPRKFAFLSGCLGYGFHTLIGAFVAFPVGTFLMKVAPQHCFENQNRELCSAYDFIDQWAGMVGLAIAVVVVLVCPIVFNKYVWSQLDDH